VLPYTARRSQKMPQSKAAKELESKDVFAMR